MALRHLIHLQFIVEQLEKETEYLIGFNSILLPLELEQYDFVDVVKKYITDLDLEILNNI